MHLSILIACTFAFLGTVAAEEDGKSKGNKDECFGKCDCPCGTDTYVNIINQVSCQASKYIREECGYCYDAVQTTLGQLIGQGRSCLQDYVNVLAPIEDYIKSNAIQNTPIGGVPPVINFDVRLNLRCVSNNVFLRPNCFLPFNDVFPLNSAYSAAGVDPSNDASAGASIFLSFNSILQTGQVAYYHTKLLGDGTTAYVAFITPVECDADCPEGYNAAYELIITNPVSCGAH